MDKGTPGSCRGRRHRTVLCAMLLAGTAVFAATLQADVVHFVNGDRVSGTVHSVSGGKVVLDTQHAGRILIALAGVSAIEAETGFDLRLRDGTAVRGSFRIEESGEGVVVSDTADLVFPLKQVYSAGQNRLLVPSFTRDWASRIDLSIAISQGNTDTASYNTLMETVLQHERSTHRASLLVSKEEADDVRTKDQLDVDYGYRRFISERWFAAGNAEYFVDELKEIDYRVTAGLGMGFQFWDNSFGAFATELGASAVVEALDGERERNPAVRWAVDYNRFLWSTRLELFNRSSLLIIPESDRGEVFQMTTGLRMAVNSWLDMALRVDLRHETEPAEAADKTDTTYSLGVGARF